MAGARMLSHSPGGGAIRQIGGSDLVGETKRHNDRTPGTAAGRTPKAKRGVPFLYSREAL